MCQGSEYDTIAYARVKQSSEFVWIWLNMPQECLNMYEHGWILLNVPDYACKCLNKLFWLWQGSQYTSLSSIFDNFLNMPQALNMQGFWICCEKVIITSFNRNLNRGCLVYMFSLRLSGSNFLTNLQRQFSVRKIFRTQVFAGFTVFSFCV